MKLRYIILQALLVCTSLGYAQKEVTLSFNKDGKFKIAQFTDLHWSNTSPNCTKTVEVIKHVLTAEQPNIAILTGDVVTDEPAKEGWASIIAIFEEARVPFAVTLGNHDGEAGISKASIFDMLEASPWFIGERGPEDVFGYGNCVLPIHSSASTAKPSALLYLFDSNDYPPVTKYGHYDWIHYDQIEWYRTQSKDYTQRNSNMPLPALAFFHIPVLEFNNVVGRTTTLGTKEEGVAAPRINSGLFSSMVDMGDVMGVFVGHDHDNDYIGIEYDIALGFGRKTGADAYGILEKGARIIEMYEDKFKFDSWICTPSGTELVYYFPSGLSSVDEAAEYLPAQKVNPTQQGVAYTYYEGKFKSTAQMLNGTKVSEGVMKNITIKDAPAEDFFGYEFYAWLKIPETGVYRFYTYSDDGSKLFIDGHEVVDNDGSHNSRRADGKIALEEGFHEIRVLYFEDYMGQALEVGFSHKDIRETLLPDHLLFVP